MVGCHGRVPIAPYTVIASRKNIQKSCLELLADVTLFSTLITQKLVFAIWVYVGTIFLKVKMSNCCFKQSVRLPHTHTHHIGWNLDLMDNFFAPLLPTAFSKERMRCGNHQSQKLELATGQVGQAHWRIGEATLLHNQHSFHHWWIICVPRCCGASRIGPCLHEGVRWFGMLGESHQIDRTRSLKHEGIGRSIGIIKGHKTYFAWP